MLKDEAEQENLWDALYYALEEGSTHWYFIPNPTCTLEEIDTHGSIADGMIASIIFRDEGMAVFSRENTKEFIGVFSTDSITRGLKIFKREFPRLYKDIIVKGNKDMDSSDILFQLIVLGKYIYK